MFIAKDGTTISQSGPLISCSDGTSYNPHVRRAGKAAVRLHRGRRPGRRCGHQCQQHFRGYRHCSWAAWRQEVLILDKKQQLPKIGSCI